MPLDINKVGNYNGKSFIGNSSAKPIVGVPLRGIYTFDLSQGKLTGDDIILPGEPVKAVNKVVNTTSEKTGAGKALNPNVLSLSKPAADTDTDISGFLLTNETDVIDFGQDAPRAYKGQIVNVALLGSRTEVYLPVADEVAGVNVNTKLLWDSANNNLKVGDTAAGTIELLGPVVDGVKFKNTGGVISYEACKVAKVRL